ncbi:MAG: hypothetical protein QOE06_3684 [Thermoleophilaceae bacterium]|nr:hypothetical protein [Thermoleophilaceae bacterium]
MIATPSDFEGFVVAVDRAVAEFAMRSTGNKSSDVNGWLLKDGTNLCDHHLLHLELHGKRLEIRNSAMHIPHEWMVWSPHNVVNLPHSRIGNTIEARHIRTIGGTSSRVRVHVRVDVRRGASMHLLLGG